MQFSNRKAEDAWQVRALLEKGLLRLPDDPMVRAQFLAMKYEINAARGASASWIRTTRPDRHDALVIALSATSGAALSLRDVSFGASDLAGTWDGRRGWGDAGGWNAPSEGRRRSAWD